MTGVPALVYPGSRVLAGWWKQLVPWQPRALWIGHLLFHRIEALVGLHRPVPLDSLLLFVLRALALGRDQTLEQLDNHLHLGRSLLRQILHQLQADQLARSAAEGAWSLTDLGRQGLAEGAYARPAHERRTFHFAESEPSTGRPHFVRVQNAAPFAPWPVPEGWQFDASLLIACVAQPAVWKERHGFPQDVLEVLHAPTAASSCPTGPSPWERIILDRPERLLAVLVLVASAEQGERLIGLAVQQEGWVLQGREPVFVWPEDWRELLGSAGSEPTQDQWQQAWRAWCQPRGLPAADVDACSLERKDHRLLLRAPGRMVERLQSTRSDILKGEAWLLAGTGRVRTAARVELKAEPGVGGQQ
jgi:hypothetical protein